jgi:methylglutaconyl-CoA hydratase
MSDEPLRETRDPRGFVILTLNDPARHNALSPALIAALSAAFARLADDPACRMVCLWGAGQSFCAGGDLAWMRAQIDASREVRMAEAGKLASLLAGMNRFPKPLVGCVTGNAFGGGIGLMAVCDDVLVQAGALFGLTEARLGLIPATISPYVIARIGEGAARRLFLSARVFDCDEALQIGLAATVAPAEEFAALVESRVVAYLAASPQAMRAAKSLIRGLVAPVDDATIASTIEALADCWEQDDAGEGVAAFFAKRKPVWRS